MAIIREFRRTNIDNAAVVVNVDSVDNEFTITLNGNQIAQLNGPGGNSQFTTNISNSVLRGKSNVLVLTLNNFAGGGFNPANVQARVEVGNETINVTESSGNQSAAQGLFSQSVIVLER